MNWCYTVFILTVTIIFYYNKELIMQNMKLLFFWVISRERCQPVLDIITVETLFLVPPPVAKPAGGRGHEDFGLALWTRKPVPP